MANEAAFVSYFGPVGFPFIKSCLYFSSCNTLDICEDCVTQDLASSCITYCSAPIEGTLGANLISVIGDVSDESTCKQRCLEEGTCSVYSYYWANSTSSPETCFLLTNVGSPVRECADSTCVTGLPDCEGSDPICSYLDDDGVIMEGGVKITGVGEKKISFLRLGECPATVALAIGSGGASGSRGGGGGSGYVANSVFLSAGAYFKMVAFAGNQSEDSYVKDVATDSIIVLGEKGMDGEDNGGNDAAGGAGYSGGGGIDYPGPGGYICGGEGGRDGTAGVGCGEGGVGSNLDVTTIPLRNFKLSPGDGGCGSYSGPGDGGNSCTSNAGHGGGGGVLVDNMGPSRPDNSSGEGYGGGGGGVYGLSGVVLLDFVPEE
jgi:hypothetical protein